MSSPTPTPTGARPPWPGACWRRGVGLRHAASGSCTRTDPSSSSGGWPPPASAPITVPLSTFSTSAELRRLLGQADVAVLLAADGFRAHDYRRALVEAVPELDLTSPPPLLAPSMPNLRRLAFTSGTGSGPDPDWTVAALLDAGAAVGADVLAATEAEVEPADRMVIVHTSGSTSAPKGVIHQHGPLHPPPRRPQRAPPVHARTRSCSPTRRSSGSAASPTALLGTLLAGADPRVLERDRPSARPSTCSERTRPTMVNGFAASVAHLAARPVVPRARPLVDPARQPLADHARRRPRRPTPSCATTCWA